MPEGIKTIRIFLASSSELKADRDEFETFVMRKIRYYIQYNIVLDVIRWENFVDAMSQVGLQKEYNKAILESDIFVSLFHTKVGKYTEEEFGKAVESFMSRGKPLVYTYFKDEAVLPSQLKKEGFVSLEDFKEKLGKLPNPHYPTYYKTISDLKLHFGDQLTDILPKLTPAAFRPKGHSSSMLGSGSSRDLTIPPTVNEPTITDKPAIDPLEPTTPGKTENRNKSLHEPEEIIDKENTSFEFDDKVFALLIGIDKYENGVDLPEQGFVQLGDRQFTNLKFCTKDVLQIRKFLRQHNVSYVKDLTNTENTDRASILKELRQFSKTVNLESKKLDKDPLVIVFVSCHGITDDDGDSYFIPYDGDRSNLVGTAISHSILKNFLTELKTPKVVVLLDSCHSGGFAKAGEKGNLQHDQIANLADAESMFVIASCKPDQKSREGQGNGIFTIELLKLLEDSYQQINDENISTSNLWEPLRQNVLKASEFKQEPVTSSKAGIILGKNIKRKKENEAKNFEARLRRQDFLNAIESILDEKNKDYPVASELSFFIDTGRFIETGFENFLSTFERYANEFSRNRQLTLQELETKCDVLLNRYLQIKSIKKRSSPATVSTVPTESVPIKDPIDKAPVLSKEENFGPRTESREGIAVVVVKRFNDEQIERIVGPINRLEYYDEVSLIERTLANGVTEQIFMNKMRALSRGAEAQYKNDNYILEGISKVIKQFRVEWPNGVDEGPKNSLSVRF